MRNSPIVARLMGLAGVHRYRRTLKLPEHAASGHAVQHCDELGDLPPENKL